MVDGTIASLFTGAWMPANLANSAADGAGKWRVTQMPTADGSTTNSENGGSSLAVLASTKKLTLLTSHRVRQPRRRRGHPCGRRCIPG